MVDSAVLKLARCYKAQMFPFRCYLRPMKSANVVKVPNSASNLSNKGVNANKLKNAWKKPACIRGKVFVRYTRNVNCQPKLLFNLVLLKDTWY